MGFFFRQGVVDAGNAKDSFASLDCSRRRSYAVGFNGFVVFTSDAKQRKH